MEKVLVRDELLPGQVLAEFALALPAARLTARELIERRVRHEVAVHNQTPPAHFQSLVAAAESSATSRRQSRASQNEWRAPQNEWRAPQNEWRAPQNEWRAPQEEWRAAAAAAVQQFQANGFILLIDGRQVLDLEAELNVGPDTSVTFVRLIPLVGG